MDRRPFALAYAASLLIVAACSATSTAPDRGGTDASMDAASSPEGSDDVEVGADATAPMCLMGADCMSGQVCCGSPDMTTRCQAGPCPDLQPTGMPVQLCASDAECFVAGDICSKFPHGLPIKTCQQPVPVPDGTACRDSGGHCFAAGVTCPDFVTADCPSAGICCLGPTTSPDGGDASADASIADAGAE
jgi:hypothetical protein